MTTDQERMDADTGCLVPTITKTERRQRERYIRGGMWDDAVLVFHDGTQRYAKRSRVRADGMLVVDTAADRHTDVVTLEYDLASVARVVR